MKDEFNAEDCSRRGHMNYRTGVAFNAMANAIRDGIDDEKQLLEIATDAERLFDQKYPRKVYA